MTYVPVFRRQIGDPTTTRDSFICTMSSGAMALDYHTLGRIQVWGGDLEARQPDHVGGTGLDDLAIAWAAYGETLEIRSGQGWVGVQAALFQGRAVVLQGDYDRMGGYSCQAGFAGDHAIVVLPGYLVGDPLCTRFRVVAEATLRAYAEKLAPNIRFAVTAAHKEDVVMLAVETPYTRFRWALGAGVLNGYDPRRPGEVVTSIQGPATGTASVAVGVSWPGMTPAPIPRGGPFLAVDSGPLAGLLIVAALVTVSPA